MISRIVGHFTTVGIMRDAFVAVTAHCAASVPDPEAPLGRLPSAAPVSAVTAMIALPKPPQPIKT
jgi:hypothetical protein